MSITKSEKFKNDTLTAKNVQIMIRMKKIQSENESKRLKASILA